MTTTSSSALLLDHVSTIALAIAAGTAVNHGIVVSCMRLSLSCGVVWITSSGPFRRKFGKVECVESLGDLGRPASGGEVVTYSLGCFAVVANW